MTSATTPSFEQLPLLPDSPERHAWDVWGRDDQIGSINRLGPEEVLKACGLVSLGKVVSLNLPLDEPNPGLFPNREPYRHNVSKSGHGRDDSVDNFFLQFSSQWDALQHVRFRQYGYWGGRDEDDLDKDDSLGIHHWARHGIFGRGVLLDVLAYQAAQGEPLVPNRRFGIDGELLDRVAAHEGISLQPGDIVLMRTGWMDWYMALSQADRKALQGTVSQGEGALATPGLDGHQSTAAWLWDRGVAAIASDNVAVEALPVDRAAGFLHRRLIPLLGIALGEFWWLRDVAEACHAANRFEFLLAAAPLNLRGGVGSPANAYAIL
jgi:kynurenine formamidase